MEKRPNAFVSQLLCCDDKNLVMSYIANHILAVEDMKEIVKSQYCEMFLEFIHGRLYNQQATEDTIPADVVPSQAKSENSVEEPTQLTLETEDTTVEVISFEEFFSQKVKAKQLVIEATEPGAEKSLSEIENKLAGYNIFVWGQLFTENKTVKNILTRDEYCLLSANIHRCFGKNIEDEIFGLREHLQPTVDVYLQEKADVKLQEAIKEAEIERQYKLSAPISVVFAKDSLYYQELSRSEKNRMTRIIEKIGDWNLSSLRIFSSEELSSQLASPKLAETLQKVLATAV